MICLLNIGVVEELMILCTAISPHLTVYTGHICMQSKLPIHPWGGYLRNLTLPNVMRSRYWAVSIKWLDCMHSIVKSPLRICSYVGIFIFIDTSGMTLIDSTQTPSRTGGLFHGGKSNGSLDLNIHLPREKSKSVPLHAMEAHRGEEV
jgi:hypothetical protein